MQGTCFYMKIKPDKISEYINIHKKGNVWQEVLDNIKKSGLGKMKIYMLDEYAIVFAEGKDISKSFEYLGKMESQLKWNEETAPYMDTQPDYDSDEPVKTLECIFDFENGVQK